MGHLCLVLGYILFWIHCGMSLNCSPPLWVQWSAVVLYFLWLILDNTDGKQARRLGISSPLGLLFDHQVDALSVFTTATFLGIVSGFGDSPYTLGGWFVAMVPFYFSTWEELNTGKLEFPSFSGPSEGCVLVGLAAAFMIYETPEAMFKVQVLGMPVQIFLFWSFIILGIGGGLYNGLRVVMHCKNRATAVFSTIPFSYFVLVLATAIWASPAQLGNVAVREFLIFIGFAFAREMCVMQLAHVTDTHYAPLNLPNFVLMTAFLVNTWSHFFG